MSVYATRDTLPAVAYQDDQPCELLVCENVQDPTLVRLTVHSDGPEGACVVVDLGDLRRALPGHDSGWHLDELTARLVNEYRRLGTCEPPHDAGTHPSLEVHEAQGRVYGAWASQRHALRSLVAARLVTDLLGPL